MNPILSQSREWLIQPEAASFNGHRGNPHFPALRSDSLALSGASRRMQFPSSQPECNFLAASHLFVIQAEVGGQILEQLFVFDG